MKYFSILRLFVVLMVISFGVYAANVGNAKIAWKYRGGVPDKVTVEQISSGDVHPGDWVQVTGADWSAYAVKLQETLKIKSTSTTTQSEYHILVSPNDPALVGWEKAPAEIRTLLAVNDSKLLTGSEQGLQNYLESAGTVIRKAKNFHPTHYVALTIDEGIVEPGSGLGDESVPSVPRAQAGELGPLLGDVRKALQMASTMVGSPKTYTGIISTVPQKVREKWTDVQPVPTLAINPGLSPHASSIYWFLSGVAGLIGTFLLCGFLVLRRIMRI